MLDYAAHGRSILDCGKSSGQRSGGLARTRHGTEASQARSEHLDTSINGASNGGRSLGCADGAQWIARALRRIRHWPEHAFHGCGSSLHPDTDSTSYVHTSGSYSQYLVLPNKEHGPRETMILVWARAHMPRMQEH